MRKVRILLFIPLAGALPALAEHADHEDMADLRMAVETGEIRSLAAILPGVMTVLPGEVIEVKFQRQASGPVYLLTVLTPDWRIWTLTVDAVSGAVLSPAPEVLKRKPGQS